jgi:hypothetical protein
MHKSGLNHYVVSLLLRNTLFRVMSATDLGILIYIDIMFRRIITGSIQRDVAHDTFRATNSYLILYPGSCHFWSSGSNLGPVNLPLKLDCNKP